MTRFIPALRKAYYVSRTQRGAPVRISAGMDSKSRWTPGVVVALLLSGSTLGEPAGQFAQRLVAGAMERLSHRVTYDGSYRRIGYPNGDVPDDVGVCSDLVIRAYRSVGIDLQRLVHEDMAGSFDRYPKLWGNRRPDPNIDHRRVPNLRVFFRRNGIELAGSRDADSYQPGDLVTWNLPGNLPHIGIVAARRSVDGIRPLVIHNIGAGPKLEDALFRFPITGHYRYTGPVEILDNGTRAF